MAAENSILDLASPALRCAQCPIRNRAVCSYSSPEQLALLDDIKFYRDYAPGQEIFGEGELTTSLGSIVEGVASLQKTLDDGRRQTVGLLFPSDFIGRPFRPTAPYDAIAVTPVRMCMFRRSQFEDILSRNSSLERRLLEMMLDELDAARDWMVLLGRKTAQERLASFLLILARRQATLNGRPLQDGAQVPIPLTREAIAEFLGLTIETVSRQFTTLRKLLVVGLPDRRSFVLTSVAALERLAAADVPDVPRSASS